MSKIKDNTNHNSEICNKHDRLERILKETKLFSHFIKKKDEQHGENSKLTEDKNSGTYKRRNQYDEDVNDNETTQNPTARFDTTPFYITNGEMRDYQISGLNWMISLYDNGINGILADEMGLGKTLQTISVLGYLKHYRGINGHHIVIVPKSTLNNWMDEFKKWCPSLAVVSFIGPKDARKYMRGPLARGQWDVCITTYEMVLVEKSLLQKFDWHYLIIDEAHRIKNEKTKLAEFVREFKSVHRLLLTGTPLQNNLHELWALLNFLVPELFKHSEDFDSWFSEGSEIDTSMVERLHSVLRPFLLRRIKADVEKGLLPKKEVKVYIGLSELQREWYTKLLLKDIDIANGVGEVSKMRLLHLLMHLRKCANHPYLFPGCEPGPPYVLGDHLINSSGKMIVLDKLLPRLKEQGSRVLLFSQMTSMLDILEDYFFLRGYQYYRLDGQTDHDERHTMINEFNSASSDKFIFMLSTRAGGLGINLASADVVIIYDSDWNPQVDLQAMDRAHRIGQKKQVRVFRLIAEHSVDEKIIEKAEMKLRLDRIVIQQGRHIDSKPGLNSNDMLEMIRHGVHHIMNNSASEIIDQDIDTILNKAEIKTKELEDKLTAKDDCLRNLAVNTSNSESLYIFEGEDYRKKQKLIADNWIEPPKRDKVINYNANDYYRAIFQRPPNPPPIPRPKKAKIPTVPVFYDFQFYSPKLLDLLKREIYNLKKASNFQCSDDVDEQRKVDDAVPLTEGEIIERNELQAAGFDWRRKDFINFVKANAKYGRSDLENISKAVEGKTPEEVKRYSEVFWERVNELDDAETVLAQIKSGEQKIMTKIKNEEEKLLETIKYKEVLENKMKKYEVPLQELQISYGNINVVSGESSRYRIEEDRFMLYTIYQLGLDKPNVYDHLKDAIMAAPEFRFDQFIKNKTPDELEKRCKTLLRLIEREHLLAQRREEREAAKEAAKNSINSKEEGPPQKSVAKKRKSQPSNGKKGLPLSTTSSQLSTLCSDEGNAQNPTKKRKIQGDKKNPEKTSNDTKIIDNSKKKNKESSTASKKITGEKDANKYKKEKKTAQQNVNIGPISSDNGNSAANGSNSDSAADKEGKKRSLSAESNKNGNIIPKKTKKESAADVQSKQPKRKVLIEKNENVKKRQKKTADKDLKSVVSKSKKKNVSSAGGVTVSSADGVTVSSADGVTVSSADEVTVSSADEVTVSSTDGVTVSSADGVADRKNDVQGSNNKKKTDATQKSSSTNKGGKKTKAAVSLDDEVKKVEHRKVYGSAKNASGAKNRNDNKSVVRGFSIQLNHVDPEQKIEDASSII